MNRCAMSLVNAEEASHGQLLQIYLNYWKGNPTTIETTMYVLK